MANTKPTIKPLGDTGILVSFGDQLNTHTPHAIQQFINTVATDPFSWMTEVVPAYTTVAIYYDLLKLEQEPNPYIRIKRDLEALIENINFSNTVPQKNRSMEIPICYGGEYGPDLDVVATHTNLSAEEVITLHANGEYVVHMIGFAPGFPYLSGMSEELATPRRETPRLKIPAGSVGIAGIQTGVYPLESPGGWQIIGRTPLALFRPHLDTPSLLKMGDAVRFYPISPEEIKHWSCDQDDY